MSEKKELSEISEDPVYYSFGLVLGLARKIRCLAAVTEKQGFSSGSPRVKDATPMRS